MAESDGFAPVPRCLKMIELRILILRQLRLVVEQLRRDLPVTSSLESAVSVARELEMPRQTDGLR